MTAETACMTENSLKLIFYFRLIAQAQETQRAVSKFKGTISFRFSANVHSFLSQELLKSKQKSDEPLEEAALGNASIFLLNS